VEPFDRSEAAPHWSAVTVVAVGLATREMVADWLEPLSDAVRVAVWLVVMFWVPTENVAVVEPADTFQVVGATSKMGALSAIVTVAPPAGAAWVRVILQKVAELEDNDEAVHCSELTVTPAAATSEMLVEAVVPFRDAVREAV